MTEKMRKAFEAMGYEHNDDLLETPTPEKGQHRVKLVCWEKVPPVINEKTNEVESNGYYDLLFLMPNGDPFEHKIYGGGVAYFQRGINNQFEGKYMGSEWKTSAILNDLMKDKFDIWVGWSKQYGVQVGYYDNGR